MENDKPKMMKPVPPFVKFVCANVPMVFDDSLSYYEALCALWKYIQDCVDVINNNALLEEEFIEKFKELKSYVENYFDNLDVQEEINNKLDDMVEDGSFARILEEGVGSKSTYIGFTRLMRELHATPDNPAYSLSDYPLMQGGCYITNDVFVQCSIRSDDNTNALLRVIDLTTGAVQRSAVLPLMHANSVTYNPVTNELYICSLVQGTTNQHYLYIVDYATLTISDTIEFTGLADGEGVHSISYDPVSTKTVLCTEQRGTNNVKFYYVDFSDNSLTEIELENYHNLLTNSAAHKWANNDICVYNNILYLLKHSPNVIVTFNLSTKKCMYVYNCQQFLRYGVNTGEFENISVNPETGDFYVGCTRLECRDGWYRIFNYLMTNFQKGVECNNLNLGADYQSIYVDAASDAIDPTGTSAKPYKTIAEALEQLNLNEVDVVAIYLAEGTYPFVDIRSNKIINIRPEVTEDQDNYIVKGIAGRASNLFITGITINGTGDYDCNFFQSKLDITGCKFRDSIESINIQHSSLTLFSCRDANGDYITIRTAGESIVDAHDSVPSYKITNDLPTFLKPIEVVGGFTSVKDTLTTKSYVGNEDVIENNDANLYLWLTSQAGYVKVPFKGSSETKSSYCSGVSGGKMCRFAITQDVDAKTIGFRTQSVIELTSTTPSDAKSSTAFSGSIFVE